MHPMTSVPRRDRREKTEISHVKMQAEMEWCSLIAKDRCQKLDEAKRIFPPRDSGGSTACQHVDFGFRFPEL